MKTIYLWLIRLMSLLNIGHKPEDVIYLMSFGNNVDFIKRLAQKLPAKHHLIVYYRPETEAAATDLAAFGIRTVPFRDNLRFVLHGIADMMQAKIIFCDNYYAFLGGLIHRKHVKIVQLWHANGAIKKFGWEDPTTKQRIKSDKRRFQAVYNQFDDYIVASPAMGQVFANSYHVDQNHMHLLGYPRSDQYQDMDWIKATRRRIFATAPELKNKRVIVYAPTYRPHEQFKLPAGVSDALCSDKDAIVVVKLHPVLRSQEDAVRAVRNPQIKFYHQIPTSDLLTVCDTLITDYSSVAFDYALLKSAHKIIFYMFDQQQYQNNPGIQDDYLHWLPKAPITEVEQLKREILATSDTDFTKFNQHWNTYNDGQATERVINHYLNILVS